MLLWILVLIISMCTGNVLFQNGVIIFGLTILYVDFRQVWRCA